MKFSTKPIFAAKGVRGHLTILEAESGHFRLSALGLLLLLLSLLLPAASRAAADPVPDSEELRYNVNWPSGLSLGEGILESRRIKGAETAGWEFKLTLDAAVPGFVVQDRFRALASAEFCSTELEKNTLHGKRKGSEKTTFHSASGIATRVTAGGGGKTEIPIPACARDALTYIQFLRSEVARGRVPPSQTVLFGAAYQVRIEFAGVQKLRVADEMVDTDRMTAYVKGPASDFSFELYLARDAVRTPVLVKVPMSLATFQMELVR